MKKIVYLISFFIFLFFIHQVITRSSEKIEKHVLIYEGEAEKTILHCKSILVSGKKNGKSKCYDEAGNLFLEEYFIEDKRDGSHTIFYPSGRVKEVRNYTKDSLDGVSVVYYPSGGIKFSKFFRNGEYVYEKEFSTNGELLVSGIKVNIEDTAQGNFHLGETYNLKFQLDYSEHDTLFLAGLFDLNEDGFFEDTLFVEKDFLSYQIQPIEKGVFSVSGFIIEVDGNSLVETGEGAFEYKYKVQ